MQRLSKDETMMKLIDDETIIVGAHVNHGYIHHTKVRIADVPNDLVSTDDLKRLSEAGGVLLPTTGALP